MRYIIQMPKAKMNPNSERVPAPLSEPGPPEQSSGAEPTSVPKRGQAPSPEGASGIGNSETGSQSPFQHSRIHNQGLATLAAGLRSLTGNIAQHTEAIVSTIADYELAAQHEFHQKHDHFKLVGQDNIRRYLPVQALCIRVTESDTWFDIVARAAAAKAIGCRVTISSAPGVHTSWLKTLHDLTETWAADIEFIEQTDTDLIEAIAAGEVGRLRYAAPDRVPESIHRAVIGHYVHIADNPVTPIGRVELLWYVQEQSVCIDYHRYGNLGDRADEIRATVT